ncbi:Zn(II)2Cys6 transcription factor domain-containing protein [Sporobolomyces salmoneus]|uniref:Zn(II)2Cys6 transcription factor domain-containing protein n=1 Tax=Sporobolomyces salmoneus TaxID=183962 RepID=UPI00317C73BD
MSSQDAESQNGMPPPPSPVSSQSKGKQKAKDDADSNTLGGSKRKRLACEICRVRRVKCVWKDSENSCLACLTAEYQCPGEPTRKKRLKKGEIQNEKMLELEAKFRHFEIGGAMTFQLIERGFKHAPPTFPGLPTGYYKQYVRTCAGASKEREIAAEVLCSAFVAGAASFTDHAKIVGSVSPDMPVETPAGCYYNYESLTPFGSARSEAVLALAFQSRQIFEDSTMRHRPSPESIYCLIAMDWMANLTREAVERGRGGTEVKVDAEFAEVLCRSYRTLMMGRRSEIGEKDLELLMGPVNAHLFSLDARNAAIAGSKLVFRDIDLTPLFPLASNPCATPLVNYSVLDPDRDYCQELGKQLLPLVYSTALLYRKFQQLPSALCDSVVLLEPIWTQIDLSLSNLALMFSTLPTLLSIDENTRFRYDLEGVIQTQQLHLAQLDLLIHQKIVQAFVGSSTSSTPPSPKLLGNYTTSRSRTQDAVRSLARLARIAVETSSWRRAREIVETLSVCSAWTSLARPDEAINVKVDLMNELGITVEIGQIFEQCLALAAWSSPSAAIQRDGLLLTLAFAFGPLPPNSLPPPPTTLPPAPKPPPVSSTQRLLPTANPSAPRQEDDFEIDLSFLDAFAREHGSEFEQPTLLPCRARLIKIASMAVPIEDGTNDLTSSTSELTPSSTLAPALPHSDDWTSITSMATSPSQLAGTSHTTNEQLDPFAFNSIFER